MIIRAKAPLRLGLAGGGTDIAAYCEQFGGAVLNVTINMYAYCTIEPLKNDEIIFYAADLKQEYKTSSSNHALAYTEELILHKGVYNRIKRDFAADKKLSFKMTTHCDAPAGSGLGSSSTLVVAMIKAYMEWLNLPLGEYDIAQMAYEIEREELGLAGGKQDQYAATFGGFNFIEFAEGGHVIVNPLRIKSWICNEVENSLVLFYTGVSRESAKIIDDQINTSVKVESKSIEYMHSLKQSAYEMKSCLLKGEFEDFARCLQTSWEAKKKTSKVISNSSIDAIYDYIIANGGKAAKISGAGGGGFSMIICDPVRRFELIEALKKLKSGQVFTASFTDKGMQAWTLY